MDEDPTRDAKRLGLTPMEPLDPTATSSTSELLRGMSRTAFTGRSLGEAADVMEEMLRDDCWVVMTLSGAMTMAGMTPLIRETIRRGWVKCIVSTGALVGHGLVEDLGMVHYKHDPAISDERYFSLRLNRVYDVLEPENNLDQLEARVRAVFVGQGDRGPLGSWELLRALGEALGGSGVLQDAAAADVPIFIPAFTDSELGLDLAVHNEHQRRSGAPEISYDAFRDLERFRELCEQQAAADRKLGVFTIGGGVPRNWAQQVGPFSEVRNRRLGREAPAPRYSYGVRICPDPVHYGHLSGCTYSEGVSWGKFVPPAEGGRYAEVLLDATVGWPLLTRALIERGL